MSRKVIERRTFDEERALYGTEGLLVRACRFDGPADGESALKESRDVQVEKSFFNLRYPFWHDRKLSITGCELTALCRAALWYSEDITISDTKLHGVKALRECARASLRGCDIVSPEFGWSARDVEMEDCTAEGEYFMMRAKHLAFQNVRLQGKYSFQYIENAVLENCRLDTKDAFWHAKNVTVKNSVVRGEYLAWYAENITFDHCTIIGTQPLCYCRGLRLIDCEMIDADLAFERSEVEATLTAPLVSIKNPLSGQIRVPAVGELIFDIPEAKGRVLCCGQEQASKKEAAGSCAQGFVCTSGCREDFSPEGQRQMKKTLKSGKENIA